MEVTCKGIEEISVEEDIFPVMRDWERSFVGVLKEIGRVDLLGLLDRREWPEVWAKMVKACSKSGEGRA